MGPRDGLQNDPRSLSTADKVEYAARAHRAGVRRVEATSFVHPRLVPQMADAEEVVAGLREKAPTLVVSGLVLNRRGHERAMAVGVDEVNCVLVASETFSRRNQGMGIADCLEEITAIVGAASAPVSVTLATAFGCPFEGRIEPEVVLALARRVADLGVAEIALADTIGVGVPAQVGALLGGLARVAPAVRRRCHFHNTRNTGYANALAAVEAGVDVLDAATGGIGGCPFAPAATGNIATEDLLYLLAGEGIDCGVDLDATVDNARWLGERLGGAPLPGLLSRAGTWPA